MALKGDFAGPVPHQPSSNGLVADRPLYLNDARDRILEAGDPAACFVLISFPGGLISPEEVTRLGLELVEGRVEQPGAPAAPKAKKAKAEPKAPPAGD